MRTEPGRVGPGRGGTPARVWRERRRRSDRRTVPARAPAASRTRYDVGVRRVAVHALNGLPLAAVVALTAASVRARHHHDEIMVQTRAGRCTAIGSHPGGLHLAWEPTSSDFVSFDSSASPSIRLLRRTWPVVAWVARSDADVGRPALVNIPPELWSSPPRLHAGFASGAERCADDPLTGGPYLVDPSRPPAPDAPPRSWLVHRLAVPFWFLLTASAALPVCRAVRTVLRRGPPGSCRRCGYDLRATPDRCPECGAAPAVAAGPSAAPI
jgi:hypothetical protein